MPKPQRAEQYTSEQTKQVHAVCLSVSIRLGGLMDEIVIVGGLVPTLLFPPESIGPGAELHVGTMDLDIGLSAALLDTQRYTEIAARLRAEGFEPDRNEDGNETYQRWVRPGSGVTVDFLVPPVAQNDRGGELRHFEATFAGIITPGLHLAAADRIAIPLEGANLDNEHTRQTVNVCGPVAFVVLKLLALGDRGEPKDAYDIDYVLAQSEQADLASRLGPLAEDACVVEAMDVLRAYYERPDSVGPARVAGFLEGRPNEAIQADAWGRAQSLLEAYEKLTV
jgi:hypothetical protein